MKKGHKTKLMINLTDKVKQDKNRQYRKMSKLRGLNRY